MARVVALIPDLLFGSRVQAAFTAAGDEVVLVADADGVREGLVDVDVLVVDLTDEPVGALALSKSLSGEGSLARNRHALLSIRTWRPKCAR